MVENGQIHAVLGTRDTQKKSNLYFRELCRAPIACVCAPDHPLAAHETLTQKDLAGNFIACSPRHTAAPVFALQSRILTRLPPDQQYYTESVESAFTLVRSRLGYTLYPDVPRLRDPDLCYIPVTDLPSLPFGIFYRYDNDHPVLKRFLNLLTQDV